MQSQKRYGTRFQQKELIRALRYINILDIEAEWAENEESGWIQTSQLEI
jgi:hypothetical protein